MAIVNGKSVVAPYVRQRYLQTPYAYYADRRPPLYLRRLMRLLRSERRMAYIMSRPRLQQQLAKHMLYVRQEYPAAWSEFEPLFNIWFMQGGPYLDPNTLYTVFGDSKQSALVPAIAVSVIAIVLLVILLAVWLYRRQK